MFGKHASLIVAASLALVNTACDTCHKCDKYKTATDLTIEKIDRSMNEPREHLTNMADNAMLYDMSVADIHFVPHSAEDRKSTRLNSSHIQKSRMPSSA